MDTVASVELVNSTKGSEIIREATGRKCSRQNLEKLCRAGRLPKSCVSLQPLRLDARILAQEYNQVIDVRQQKATQPKARSSYLVIDQAPDSVPRTRDEIIPDYNESRAKSEYEKSLLLELERKQKEGLLVARKDVETTWAQVITTAKTKILGVPSRAKQRIPHLSLEEIEIIGQLIREALEELAAEEEELD